MSRSPRVLSLAVAGALALAAVPSTAAAKAPVARVAHPSHALKINLPLPSGLQLSNSHQLARAASLSNAWLGSGAQCVGTAVTLSVGRQFGYAPGTYFQFRTRLYAYNPWTGVQGFTSYGPWISDQVPPAASSSGGTVIITNPGGVNPTSAPTSVWSVNHGWYVTPYAQISGLGERPVNFEPIYGPDFGAAPNWCYVS